MKNNFKITQTLLLFILLLCSLSLMGQFDYTCFDTPRFQFEGVDIDFTHVITDELIDQDGCSGDNQPYYKDYGSMEIAPLEHEDKLFLFLRTARKTGTKIVCLKDNEVQWERIVNMTNNHGNRAYNIARAFINRDSKLELLTNNGLSEWSGNYNPVSDYGLPGRETIDPNTGETLYQYWYGDTVNVQGFNAIEAWPLASYICNDGHYNYIEEDGIYQSTIFRSSTLPNQTGTAITEYTDSISLIKSKNYVYKTFQHIDASGNKGYLYRQGGPYFEGDSLFYLLRYNIDSLNQTKTYLSMIYMDKLGNITRDLDITSAYNPYGLHLSSRSIDTQMREFGDRIIIYSYIPPKNGGKNNSGFAVIDKKGNHIHSRYPIEFDGISHYLGSVVYLKERDSYLHFIQEYEEGNIHIFEEFNDGSHRKAGVLHCDTEDRFGYYVRKGYVLNNGDLILGIGTRTNLLNMWGEPYLTGGWGAIVKISAEALGVSSASDHTVLEGQLYPNPTDGILRLDGITTSSLSVVELYGLTGKLIERKEVNGSKTYDLGGYAPGVYIVRIKDSNNNLISMDKIVKL